MVLSKQISGGQMELSEAQAACIGEYAAKTGISEQQCLDEAIDDWIRVVATIAVKKDNVVLMERREA
jgi:hypothetical protein